MPEATPPTTSHSRAAIWVMQSVQLKVPACTTRAVCMVQQIPFCKVSPCDSSIPFMPRCCWFSQWCVYVIPVHRSLCPVGACLLNDPCTKRAIIPLVHMSDPCTQRATIPLVRMSDPCTQEPLSCWCVCDPCCMSCPLSKLMHTIRNTVSSIRMMSTGHMQLINVFKMEYAYCII